VRASIRSELAEGETRILLLRHAETAAPDRFHGAESDIGISDRGRVQAETVARQLVTTQPSALYCSGMLRARETAAPIAISCRLDAQIIEDLHERRMGIMSGMARLEGWPAYETTKSRWMAGDLDATHEGAETYRQIQDRVVPPFLRIADGNQRKTVVVVAHGVVIRVLMATLVDGLSHADFDRIGIEFVAVNDLRWHQGRWRLNSALTGESVG
jgi:2,3-bisphosphoglycerate-dependent phosphoglycerate mutase